MSVHPSATTVIPIQDNTAAPTDNLNGTRRKSLRVVPLTLKQANELISRLHRHHKRVQGHRFSLGVELDGQLVGACTVGRPVSRELPAYSTAEVTRLVTDGTPHACSKLYGVAAKICKEMGFMKIQTYILEEEPGTSLKAAGWVFEGFTNGGTWNCLKRTGRREDQPKGRKQRWARVLNEV